LLSFHFWFFSALATASVFIRLQFLTFMNHTIHSGHALDFTCTQFLFTHGSFHSCLYTTTHVTFTASHAPFGYIKCISPSFSVGYVLPGSFTHFASICSCLCIRCSIHAGHATHSPLFFSGLWAHPHWTTFLSLFGPHSLFFSSPEPHMPHTTGTHTITWTPHLFHIHTFRLLAFLADTGRTHSCSLIMHTWLRYARHHRGYFAFASAADTGWDRLAGPW